MRSVRIAGNDLKGLVAIFHSVYNKGWQYFLASTTFQSVISGISSPMMGNGSGIDSNEIVSTQFASPNNLQILA